MAFRTSKASISVEALLIVKDDKGIHKDIFIYLLWVTGCCSYISRPTNCKSCPWTVAFQLVLQSDLAPKIFKTNTPHLHLHPPQESRGTLSGLPSGSQRWFQAPWGLPWPRNFSWIITSFRSFHLGLMTQDGHHHFFSSLALSLRSALPLWIACQAASDAKLMRQTHLWGFENGNVAGKWLRMCRSSQDHLPMEYTLPESHM